MKRMACSGNSARALSWPKSRSVKAASVSRALRTNLSMRLLLHGGFDFEKERAQRLIHSLRRRERHHVPLSRNDPATAVWRGLGHGARHFGRRVGVEFGGQEKRRRNE